MGLKIPNLDNKDFKQFREEALAKLPVYSSKWTDHNASDPGITIVELLAWMSDINSYRLDRIGEEHYLAFLELLGEKRKEIEVVNTLEEELLGESSGYAKQCFILPFKLLPSSVELFVNEKAWKRVDEFFSTLPEDEVYRIEDGKIVFGDDAYGKIPFRGGTIKINAQILTKETKVFESIDEVFKRIKRDASLSCNRAVTLEDYEYLLLNTSMLNLARVKAIANHEKNSISVMVVPFSQLKEPKVDKVLLRLIRKILNQKKLLTTQIEKVENPIYTSVNIKLEVKTRYMDTEFLETKIREAIESFLHPIYGGLDNSGWNFGEDLHVSHIYMLLQSIEGIENIDALYFGGNSIKVEVEKNSLLVSGKHRINVQSIKPLGVCL